jgi:hypothetical protein
MIKCPECKKDVSEAAAACPSCGHPVAQTVNAAQKEKEKLEKKQGCGGCLVILGILALLAGLATFIGARKSAGDLIQSTSENFGSERVATDEALAKAAGHGSYSDFLTEQNQSSGGLFIAVGIGLAIVGYKMYKKNSPKKDSPETKP